MNYPARTDQNQKNIVAMFRTLNCSVEQLHAVGSGVPDLLVGIPTSAGKYNLLVEVKMGKARLNKRQQLWHDMWKGQVTICRNPRDVIKLVKAYRKEHS